MGTITPPFVSVIIPTYNRKESLLRTLDSLARQTYPAEHFEVIVVDDGGSDGSEVAAYRVHPFRLRYLHQANQGATAARNYGATQSQGFYLIFVDDDIVLASWDLQHLVEELKTRRQTIILGTLLTLPMSVQEGASTSLAEHILPAAGAGEYVSFQECMTGLLAIQREDFFRLGMFQDPTGGWPNWDDVDFGYRASKAGFYLWRSAAAIAQHCDYSVSDRTALLARWYRASVVAPRLFERHPEIRSSILMFREKEPIAWRSDPPSLIWRKLLRRAIWSRPFMAFMEYIAPFLERHAPDSTVLRLLHRWIGSGYIYRGYRQGLKDMARKADR